jgi:predicted metal-dependent HD superfamily phosphohydrolase
MTPSTIRRASTTSIGAPVYWERRSPVRSTLEQAVSLVLATKKHIPEGFDDARRSNAAIFLDMDLSILGADELRPDAYEDEIRAEYAHVPEEEFRAGPRSGA